MLSTAHEFSCPSCGEDFSEDDMMDVCNEPFNGSIIKCSSCEKEFDVNIMFNIEEIL